MSVRCASWLALLLLLSTVSHLPGTNSQGIGDNETGVQPVCVAALNPIPVFPSNDTVAAVTKLEYRIGVLAIRGFDAAYTEFNTTFSDYLTETAGKRFADGGISFKLIPLNFLSLFSDVELATATTGAEGVDFIYVNPSAFSCIESEYGANTLVSQISKRNVGGESYDLTKFGGVIFTRYDNDLVNEVEDLKDKIVACASISGLGSGQMQFRLMQQRGLAYVQDPKQLIFTSNQGKVVNGVLTGAFEVGFVRTDQIERTTDASTGELVDPNLLKIINPSRPLLDGEPFPFESSTILYPEWNVGALSHVPDDVAVEVQSAMLAIQGIADVGAALQECYQERLCEDQPQPLQDACKDLCFQQVDPDLLAQSDCETTSRQVADLAFIAKVDGRYTGWRSTLSYMELRNMQEETNFIRKQDDGINACIRSSQIVDAVVCPPGHFRKSDEDVLNGCAEAGLDCGGFQCLCKPCVEAFDVDVAPVDEVNQVIEGACPKFTLCGTVEQSKTITFRAVDNKERADADISAYLLIGSDKEVLEVERVGNYTYDFPFTATGLGEGIIIMEVFIDGEQIPESPFQVGITERECGANRVAKSNGETCGLSDAVLIPSIVIPLLILLALGVYFYVERKKKQADTVWSVKIEELHFDDPPAILGRGTFGLVLLAEYRGTQVAVKRVIPPKLAKATKNNTASQSSFQNSMLGSGDFGEFVDMPEQNVEIKIDLEDNDNDISNGDRQADAMESGSSGKRVLPKMSAGASGSFHQLLNNKASSEASVAGTEASKQRSRRRSTNTDALFNFDNLDSYGQRSASIATGLASGGINKLSSGTEKPSRRHSSFVSQSDQELQAAAMAAATCFAESDDDESVGGLGRMMPGDGFVKQRRRSSSGAGASEKSAVSDKVVPLTGRQPRPKRRHSLSGFVRGKAPMQLYDVDNGVHDGDRRMSGTPSDSSFASLAGDDFRKLLELEEQKATRGSNVTALQSTKLVVVKGGEMGSMRGSRTASLTRKNGRLVKLKNSVFGQDEYWRLKKDFIDEMRQLSKLRHPCITTVMGAVISNRAEPMLVMEYMDHGSLYDLLHNESMVVDGELVLPILRDISQGVRFLHAANPLVIHGDLKAQNVLVDSKFRAKVADFGLSGKKTVGATGTPLWMAPELLRGESENTPMSDVFSFGIILYEVYSRKDPYEGEDLIQVLSDIVNPNINKRPKVPSTCPPKVASIMADCLGSKPVHRPNFEELDLRLKRLDIENVEPGQMIFSMQKKKEERALKNQTLLFDVFPRHVAEALSDGRKVEAESFECATVFFSDIVGYTTISSTLPARKVSDMLDRLYDAFDALSEQHDIFKIDTIGDAYMCVTNLHKNQDDHAARMARFCIDAVAAANDTLIDADHRSKGYVKIRVGFHSGPIVADVVGSRSPKYTLFGDTVNTASRMESNSLSGRIQCSEKSAKLIQEQDASVPLVSRGKIHVKGKGDMQTYWVGEVSPSDEDAQAAKRLSAVLPRQAPEELLNIIVES